MQDKGLMMTSRPARAGFMAAWVVADAPWEKWGRPTFHRAPRVALGPLAVGACAVSPPFMEVCASRARGYCRDRGSLGIQPRLLKPMARCMARPI